MIDIISAENGQDLGLFNTQNPKAANVLSIQLGSLEYAPDFGIDLKYFLSEDFRFQNESFKAYMVEVLANNNINVTSILDEVYSLYNKYTFNIGADEASGSLIAR